MPGVSPRVHDGAPSRRAWWRLEGAGGRVSGGLGAKPPKRGARRMPVMTGIDAWGDTSPLPHSSIVYQSTSLSALRIPRSGHGEGGYHHYL